MRSWAFISTIFLGLGLTHGALAPRPAMAQGDAKSIGKVLSASGTVTVQHTGAVVLQANLPSGAKVPSKIGDLVYQGDLVETGRDGLVGIVFLDGTSFSLSNNARMELNELVYDPKGKSNSTLFSLQKGTFTFIAGAIAKTGDMKIDTPVGTMGIRGTAPRVEILDDGTVKFTTLIEEYKKEQQTGTRNASRAEALETLDLCNTQDPGRTQNKIQACRTLAETHVDKPQSLAIVYNNLGSARVVNGDYDDAIADYSESIRLDPASAKAFNNRGIAYQRKGDNARALADFSQALRISPSYVFALANRAKAYELTGDIDRALVDIGEAIRVQPTSGAYWNERCWIRATRRSAQEALTDCNEAIRLGPASAAKFDSRGLAHLKIGNAPLSIADYTSALALQPQSASALYGRGLAKRLAGDTAGANADIAAATAINGAIASQFAQFGLR